MPRTGKSSSPTITKPHTAGIHPTTEEIALRAIVPRHRVDRERDAHHRVGKRKLLERVANQTQPAFLIGRRPGGAQRVGVLRLVGEREDERQLAAALALRGERGAHRREQ